MNQIHAHDVLNMMQGKAYTLEGLLQEIEEKFGPDARFFNCHHQDLQAIELIELFLAHGRFVISLNPGGCGHHHEEGGGECHCHEQ
jgi:probable metal-binding protein